jgi:tRNA-dihydrouridine synthase
VVGLRNQLFGIDHDSEYFPLILGNGDVKSLSDCDDKIKTFGVDGVMVGRAIFHNPWFFNPNIYINDKNELFFLDSDLPIVKDHRIKLLSEHINLWNETWKDLKNYNVLKKYFKIYIQGFSGAGDLRGKLMETANCQEALEILRFNSQPELELD